MAEAIVADLRELVAAKNCGAILIRLSWHDAGVFSSGALKGGCPNAAQRFRDAGEGAFEANAGLDVAIGLLAPVAERYVAPGAISHADLWALAAGGAGICGRVSEHVPEIRVRWEYAGASLNPSQKFEYAGNSQAANVATEAMGGPRIPTRFGRVDAASAAESVASQEGRLPDGDKGVPHLREIFHPKGFSDRDIVALSGAHTVGGCKAERSGFDGAWTARPRVFDNSYFKDLLTKTYAPERVAATGCPQHRHASGTIMLASDLALLEDPAFKAVVEEYASDQDAFFRDYTSAWVRLQELGTAGLRDAL